MVFHASFFTCVDTGDCPNTWSSESALKNFSSGMEMAIPIKLPTIDPNAYAGSNESGSWCSTNVLNIKYHTNALMMVANV